MNRIYPSSRFKVKPSQAFYSDCQVKVFAQEFKKVACEELILIGLFTLELHTQRNDKC